MNVNDYDNIQSFVYHKCENVLVNVFFWLNILEIFTFSTEEFPFHFVLLGSSDIEGIFDIYQPK